MTIDEFKKHCLKSINKEAQLEEAEKAAKNSAMENYHCGRKQIWHEVHDTLVRWFEMNHDAVFTLKTNPKITGMDVLQQIEKDLDGCLIAYGLVRVGSEKSDVVEIYYDRVAFTNVSVGDMLTMCGRRGQ